MNDETNNQDFEQQTFNVEEPAAVDLTKSEDIAVNEVLNTPVNMNQGKKNNKNLIIGICTAVVVFVVIIGIVAAMSLQNPKNKVKKAFQATADELNQKTTFIKEVTGQNDLTDNYKDGLKESISFSLENSNVPEISQFNGTGINLDFEEDIKNKKLNMNISGKYKGTELGSIAAYTDNKTMMINVPSLYKSWFTFDCEHIEKQYNSSIFGKSGSLPDEEISFKVFPDEEATTYSSEEVKEILVDGYKNANKETLKEIDKNITVEKLSDKKDITIGGTVESCKGYSILIPKAESSKFISSFCEYAKKDPKAKELLEQYFTACDNATKYQQTAYGTSFVLSGDYNEKIDKLKEMFKAEDINIKVYTDKKGRAVNIDLDTSLIIGNYTIPVKSSVTFKGKENIGDDTDIKLNISYNGLSMDIDVNSKCTEENSKINHVIKGSLTAAGQKLDINCIYGYGKDDKKLNGDFELSDGVSRIALTYSGSYNYDKSNKQMSYTIDEIKGEANEYGQAYNIVGKAALTTEPLKDGVKEPAGDKVEIFKITEAEAYNMMMEIQKNAEALQDAFNVQ